MLNCHKIKIQFDLFLENRLEVSVSIITTVEGPIKLTKNISRKKKKEEKIKAGMSSQPEAERKEAVRLNS